MSNSISIKVSQLSENIISNGISNTLKEIFFLNRNVIVFEKDLDNLNSKISPVNKSEIEFINISKSNFSRFSAKFPSKSRYLKTLKNTNKGYESFALIRNNTIVGDCWFAAPFGYANNLIHPDLNMLGIEAREKDAYMFDMYVIPEERGTKSTDLLKYAFLALKDRGIKKICTFVMANNTPAIWMVRMLGFKELNRKKIHRFLLFRIVTK
jgi:GNAT superfamily N-acetyltransferase